MAALRAANLSTRASCALALALLLAMRLLSPPGFMPSFALGAVTITICPDAEASSAPAGHDHHRGHSKALHQPCAYAAAPSFGTPIADLLLVVAPLASGAAPAVTMPLAFLALPRSRERPPLRGPPIPA